MSRLLLRELAVVLLLVAGQTMAQTNVVKQTNGVSFGLPRLGGSAEVTNAASYSADRLKAGRQTAENLDPIEKEFQQLMADDDAVHEQIDEWIRSNNEFAAKGASTPREELSHRILARLEPIRKRYQDFLKQHPDHARAHVAFGSFLNDLNDEDRAVEEWEKALSLNAKDPAVYNNLAEVYAHHGPVKKAFEYYEKAIELNPRESLYYHNFGTVVYLFRKDAMEIYKIAEQQVFDKALELYAKAMKLDPDDFPLASDIAQTYYGIKPWRTEEALKAWTNALHIAHDEIEREGVYIHFARIKLLAGRFEEARQHLNGVTNEMYLDLKKRIARNVQEKENEAKGTNQPPIGQ